MKNIKLKKGMYITLDGNAETIYKILDIHHNYVLLSGDRNDYWERTEYIEYIITFDNMKVEKYES